MRAQRASPGSDEREPNESTTNGRARTQRIHHERTSANPTNPPRTHERDIVGPTTNGSVQWRNPSSGVEFERVGRLRSMRGMLGELAVVRSGRASRVRGSRRCRGGTRRWRRSRRSWPRHGAGARGCRCPGSCMTWTRRGARPRHGLGVASPRTRPPTPRGRGGPLSIALGVAPGPSGGVLASLWVPPGAPRCRRASGRGRPGPAG